ncbi:MAG: hypothetical protein JOZ73_12120 [Solirubrobacterales bacterium]|nr:hypothetical protein [Solirubrobacterales bacterium]
MSADTIATPTDVANGVCVQSGHVVIRTHGSVMEALEAAFDTRQGHLPDGAVLTRAGVPFATFRRSYTPAGRQTAAWVLT